MEPFTNKTFLDNMMLFYRDYYSTILAGNKTTLPLFVNGMVSGVVDKFMARIEQDKNNTPDSEILKFVFYSDHDDAVIVMAAAF